MDMNSRSLEYVVALYETGSLHAAAVRCNATCGTLSAQITRLEDYLGVRLFEQRSQPATPTAEGYELVVAMQQVVIQLREIRSVASQLSQRSTSAIPLSSI
jgi:DNA-binding transcriptional LysR family regulator